METRRGVHRSLSLLEELPLDAVEIRQRVVQALYGLDLADTTGAIGLAESGEGRVAIPWAEVLGDERGGGIVAQCRAASTGRHAFKLLDLHRTPPAQRRRFHSLDELLEREAFYESDTWRVLYEPVLRRPSALSDQLRLVLAHADTVVGYLFMIRFGGSEQFSRSRRRLQRLVPSIRRALVLADRHASRPAEPADFVLDPRGQVRFSSATGCHWLSVPAFRDGLRELVRDADSRDRDERALAAAGRLPIEAEVSMTRVRGTEGTRYLVHVASPRRMRLCPSASLSPAQLEVAELASSGATVPEIAEMTGRSRETVRTHLAAVYRKLDVTSRAELGRIMSAR